MEGDMRILFPALALNRRRLFYSDDLDPSDVQRMERRDGPSSTAARVCYKSEDEFLFNAEYGEKCADSNVDINDLMVLWKVNYPDQP